MGNERRPYLPPLPLNPVCPGDDDSEFGIGYEARQARRGIGPQDGGPYRALSPGQARTAGRQHRRHPARKLAD